MLVVAWQKDTLGGRKHRMVRAIEGKKKFHCILWSLRGSYDIVPGVCNGCSG